MINSIALQNLRNAEFLRFLKNTLSIYDANQLSVLRVRDQYDAVQQFVAQLDPLFKMDQGSPMTDELIALDARRDNCINGLSMYLQSLIYHFNEDTRKNANLLAANLAIYGSGIARQNYQAETEVITSIVGDWTNKPELTAASSALQLNSWLMEMRNVNNEFDSKYVARAREIGSANTDNMKSLRLQATNAYYELRDFTDSYFTINKGAAPYSTVTNELNGLISEYNTLLAGRGGKDTNTPPQPTT